MSWLLFIDESGHDRRASPYEVLAGVAIQVRVLWDLIVELHAAEIRHFGVRYSDGRLELKGRKLLKTKVFNHASLREEVEEHEIPILAQEALQSGSRATAKHLRALAFAKLGYVRSVFDLCEKFRCRAFASIVETDAHPTASDGLRKDYAYLFERFYYFLEDLQPQEPWGHGIIVFDELEKTKSHLLINQVHRYFKDTATGRQRAGLILPEPLFVHSELTTGIQIADLIAYCISWAFRTPQMTKNRRPELEPFAQQVARLRYKATRERLGNPNFTIWSFAYIPDLRTHIEKEPYQ